jgi:hypothetical protein
MNKDEANILIECNEEILTLPELLIPFQSAK